MLEKIKNIFKEVENKEEILEEELTKRQEAINEKYARDGLTDEVLEEQVELNKLRNKLNMSDPTKRIYKNFVQ